MRHGAPGPGASADGGPAAPIPAGEATPDQPRPEAPRPSWVHTAPSARRLLEEAERAVGDRYRIESIAGEGGMGRVFSARDTRLGRRVAIKLLTVLDPNPGEDPGLQAHNRLVAEARAMARLSHPNLCRVVEVSLQGQTPYLVMEWAEGVPFDAFCKRLDVRRRLSVLLQVLDALAAIHNEGLVHGDLKPSNILIGRDEKATIVDFGLARAENDPSWAALPRGGTPGYAAPELLAANAPLGPEADVFAAGVMLYEILTGRTPFYRNIAPAVMIDLLRRGGLPLPEEHAPDTPADLQKICLAALEVDPQHRYPDAASMAADIRRYLRRETVAARPRVLEARLNEQIAAQVAQAAEWRRLGLITPRDSDEVARVLQDLQRAESPWIIDARRLRASQVSLYLGGWTLLLGLVFGLAHAPPALPPAVGLPAAWLLAIAALVLGLRLQRSGEKRIGIGMLVTAQAALPAAVFLTLRQTGLLAPAADADVSREIAAALFGAPPAAGLANLQVLTVSLAGVALAAALRRVARSAAFTSFLVLFAAAAWLALFAALGGLAGDTAVAVGRWGVWLACLGAACVPLGLAIDRNEHELIRELGRRRATRRDAAPVLCGALLALGAGLTAAALAAPAWYTLRPVSDLPSAPLFSTAQAALAAWALALNGAALLAMLVLLGRETTPLRRRVAGVLRWLAPTHILAPLIAMEAADTFGLWTLWIILTPFACLAFCFASALRQWTPFLVSGMIYLAVWYARGFARIDGELAGHAGWRLFLTLTLLILGPALMLLAWRAPAWVARHRLRKWALLNPPQPSSRRARTWR